MTRPPLLDEEGDELEIDFEEEGDGYRVLDFGNPRDRGLDFECEQTLEELIEDAIDISENVEKRGSLPEEDACADDSD